MHYDDRILKTQDRGTHIAVRCRNHPNNIYSTKNIDYIGARSIFYVKGGNCDCPGHLLEVCPDQKAAWAKEG